MNRASLHIWCFSWALALSQEAAANPGSDRPLKTVPLAIVSNFSTLSENVLNPYSNSFEHGVRLALDEAKKGAKCNFVYEKIDDRGDVRSTAESARQAVASKALLALGYHSSGSALIAAPIFKEAGMAMISPSASATAVFAFGSPIVSFALSNSAQADMMLNYAINIKKAKSLGVVYPADCAYCSDLAKTFLEKGRSKSVRFVVREILENQADLEAVVKSVLAENPEVVYLPNYELLSARLIRIFVDLKYRGSFLGGDGWYNANGQHFKTLLADRPFQGIFPGLWHLDLATSENMKFVSAFSKEFGVSPDTDAALAFDVGRLAVQVVKGQCTMGRAEFIERIFRQRTIKSVVGKVVIQRHRDRVSIQRPAPLLRYDFTKPSLVRLDSMHISRAEIGTTR